MNLYFSDVFGVSDQQLEDYGAFNVSLVVDLPLFIDPFLLFNSEKPQFQKLHHNIIDYLRYLQELSIEGKLSTPRVKNLCCFSEVKQNWLGFSQFGNSGRGLGLGFGKSLADNLVNIFRDFGQERVTKGSHLEKLCLIQTGVGRDAISDFSTNLIKGFLCEFTQEFAQKHIEASRLRKFAITRASFPTTTGTWETRWYLLPMHEGDFVLLTPREILTKDDTWINKEDFYREYHDIPEAIENDQLRGQINSYFLSMLPKYPNPKERGNAIRKTALKYPELFDYFIKHKEDNGDKAEKRSIENVENSLQLYISQFGLLVDKLKEETRFYSDPVTSKDAARQKVGFLKDVIENKGGFRIFYHKGKALEREQDIQILYRLVWHESHFDVTREANDGRGPVDFKISKGSKDKTLVEMKLASNSALRRNLQNQVEIYQKASDATSALKVIIFFTEDEQTHVEKILKELKLDSSRDIFLIDARQDNKPSGSKAK